MPEARDAKTGPPNLDEWTDFFSRIVLRLASEWYISLAFRGIDEDFVSPEDIAKLSLTQNERQAISVPIAEFSNKSKFMRKHGRKMVSAAGTVDSLIILGAWASRVNRIARKYRKIQGPKNPRPTQPQNAEYVEAQYGNFGQDSGARIVGANGGIAPEGLRIVNLGGG